MYASKVEDEVLTFQVSGMLWQRSLVMRDLETETLWSHLLGRGMRGPHEGVELEKIPGAMTTWGEWKERHPETTLLALSRTARHFDDSVWKRPQKFVYGISLGAAKPSPAFSLKRLQKEGVVLMRSEAADLVATHLAKGGSVQVFKARLDGQRMTFVAVATDLMKDLETGSIWSRVSGQGLSGPLEGKQLIEVPGTVSFRDAWEAFYPDDSIID